MRWKKYNKNGFDHIISLGRNCEVAFRIQEYLRTTKIDSYPFTWLGIENPSNFPDVLNHLEVLTEMDLKYRQGDDFVNEERRIVMHSGYSADNVEQMSEKEKEEFYAYSIDSLRSKYAHLIDKWYARMKSPDSVLFVMSIHDDPETPDSEQCRLVTEVSRYLEKNMSHRRYLFLVVTDGESYYSALSRLRCRNLAVARISEMALGDQTRLGGDRMQWARVLEYYNHICDIDQMCLDLSAEDYNARFLRMPGESEEGGHTESGEAQVSQDAQKGELLISYTAERPLRKVTAAVWSDLNQQSDLVWYEMQNGEDNIWTVSVPLSAHDKGKTITIHFYRNGSTRRHDALLGAHFFR